MKFSFIIYILTLVILPCCNFKKPVNKIDINKQLAIAAKIAQQSHRPLVPFSLCELLSDMNWDSVIVIAPYSNEESFENIDIKNFDTTKDSLLAVSNDEGKCTLAYIKNKGVVGYSIVPRSPIDFCQYNQSVYLIKRSACDLAELKKIK